MIAFNLLAKVKLVGRLNVFLHERLLSPKCHTLSVDTLTYNADQLRSNFLRNKSCTLIDFFKNAKLS